MSGSRPLPLAVTASAGTAGVAGASPRIGRPYGRRVVLAGLARTPPSRPGSGHERRGRAGLVDADHAGDRTGAAGRGEHREHRADAVRRAVRPGAVDALQLADAWLRAQTWVSRLAALAGVGRPAPGPAGCPRRSPGPRLLAPVAVGS